MALPSEEEIQEVFNLFNPEGSGIKIKEIGTVMRSLGLASSQAQLSEFATEAAQIDDTFVQFSVFLSFVKRAQTHEASKSVDFEKEMKGLHEGIKHFCDKLTQKQSRETNADMVKISDIKHLLSAVGDKMSEEELEEMSREMRGTCRIQDGRVSFEDFVKMLKS
mmetsp:Transcript_38394/g.76108  ORF Transcript_38394/g.76108 Transcript_38394/m.76108 type:complete len:164 (+) Transcript_38394:76-567(+)